MVPADANHLVVDTKASLIYRRLKQDILDGRLEPGQKLAASRMAESYGVSVIPLREAFSLLIAEGLLTNIPHKGTYVTEIEVDQIEEMNPIAAILEGYAAREACSHLGSEDLDRLSQLLEEMEQAGEDGRYSEMSDRHQEFHMTIYRASKNERLVMYIEDLWQKTGRARFFGLVPTRAIRSIEEHRQIVEALRMRDNLEAERLVIEQKEKAAKAMIEYLKRREGSRDKKGNVKDTAKSS